jgi:hypothetical protein
LRRSAYSRARQEHEEIACSSGDYRSTPVQTQKLVVLGVGHPPPLKDVSLWGEHGERVDEVPAVAECLSPVLDQPCRVGEVEDEIGSSLHRSSTVVLIAVRSRSSRRLREDVGLAASGVIVVVRMGDMHPIRIRMIERIDRHGGDIGRSRAA